MNKIKSLYYHNPSPKGFEKMVCYYINRGYRFIDVGELYSLLVLHKPLTEKLAFISLDDGRRGNLQLLPVMEKYKIPVCIFVSTEPLESGNFCYQRAWCSKDDRV